jgi:hypothetical protein
LRCLHLIYDFNNQIQLQACLNIRSLRAGCYNYGVDGQRNLFGVPLNPVQSSQLQAIVNLAVYPINELTMYLRRHGRVFDHLLHETALFAAMVKVVSAGEPSRPH